MLLEFGQPNWQILRNVWLDHYGKFECDFLVVTPAGIYTFEIKNYSGHLEFQNATCLLNGKKIGHNAIYQAQKVATNLENIIHEKFPGLRVQGALIFVGEYNTVDVQHPVDNIQILIRNQIRNFIWKIANDERNIQGPGVDVDSCLRWLEQFTTDDPFGPEPVPLETTQKLRKGIGCSHCGSFDVDTSKSYITCSCGMHEPRENAIIRTICEFAVIHFDKNLKTTELFEFFNGQISRSILLKLLNKHFTRIGSNKSSRYINPKLPFSKIYHLFTLKEGRILNLDRY